MKQKQNMQSKLSLPLMSRRNLIRYAIMGNTASLLALKPMNVKAEDENNSLVIFDYDRCIHCMACVSECPYGFINILDTPVYDSNGYQHDLCVKCFRCEDACPLEPAAVKVYFGEYPSIVWSDEWLALYVFYDIYGNHLSSTCAIFKRTDQITVNVSLYRYNVDILALPKDETKMATYYPLYDNNLSNALPGCTLSPDGKYAILTAYDLPTGPIKYFPERFTNYVKFKLREALNVKRLQYKYKETIKGRPIEVVGGEVSLVIAGGQGSINAGTMVMVGGYGPIAIPAFSIGIPGLNVGVPLFDLLMIVINAAYKVLKYIYDWLFEDSKPPNPEPEPDPDPDPVPVPKQVCEINNNVCIYCCNCFEFCLTDAIQSDFTIDTDACVGCLECIDICPVSAITVADDGGQGDE